MQSIRRGNCGKRLAVPVESHARQCELRRALGQVLQSAALHINERPLPRRVHHLQHEPGSRRLFLSGAGVTAGQCQMKIVVVLARQRLSCDVKPIELTREVRRFRFRRRLRNALFKQHPEILSATRRPVHPRLGSGPNPPPKSVHSPSIAGSPATRCRTRFVDDHHPRSSAHPSKCSRGSSPANAHSIPPGSSIGIRTARVASGARSLRPPPTPSHPNSNQATRSSVHSDCAPAPPPSSPSSCSPPSPPKCP